MDMTSMVYQQNITQRRIYEYNKENKENKKKHNKKIMKIATRKKDKERKRKESSGIKDTEKHQANAI